MDSGLQEEAGEEALEVATAILVAVLMRVPTSSGEEAEVEVEEVL